MAPTRVNKKRRPAVAPWRPPPAPLRAPIVSSTSPARGHGEPQPEPGSYPTSVPMEVHTENVERHKPGFDSERAPRPLGVATNIPWEPRGGERSHAGQAITVRFLEAIEPFPWLQEIAAVGFAVVAKVRGFDEGPEQPALPDPPGAWKFAAVGDYGSGRNHQARVAANILNSKPSVVITTGDNVYPTGRWEDYRRNFDPAHLYGEILKRIPFMPALGNHDMYRDDLRPYFGHFPHLKGHPYYSYTMNNAHFMALDGDQDLRPGSAQYRWLEAELKASDKPWRVVYLHYPLYGRSLNGFPEIRDSLQPLLAKYKVQLVMTGHEHNYQRSIPIDGVTHVLTGGGGQMVFPILNKRAAWIARRKASFHHVEVSVGTDRMVVRAIDEHGKVIDTAVIPLTGLNQAQAGASAVRSKPRRARPRSVLLQAPAGA